MGPVPEVRQLESEGNWRLSAKGRRVKGKSRSDTNRLIKVTVKVTGREGEFTSLEPVTRLLYTHSLA